MKAKLGMSMGEYYMIKVGHGFEHLCKGMAELNLELPSLEAIMNDFVQLNSPLDVYEAEIMLLSDPNLAVREATILCIEEMYKQAGPQFRDELHRYNLPSYLVKDINSRLEGIQPNVRSSNGIQSGYVTGELKPLNPKKSSQKAKNSSREASLFGAEGDVTEKTIDPIKVYSNKELIREVEKIVSILVLEKDWFVRIAAMQRIEGLVLGGATDYPCFHGILKQLGGPLSTQLLDRRSSIVKKACHLLCFLSKELLGDFEAYTEMFIPVLFKLVVITVLVIAESADNYIKTMLHNYKEARSAGLKISVVVLIFYFNLVATIAQK
ncbi:hypothetical protein RYX36_005285 [Vicia faba]